jgi:hypothetical protein
MCIPISQFDYADMECKELLGKYQYNGYKVVNGVCVVRSGDVYMDAVYYLSSSIRVGSKWGEDYLVKRKK